VTPTSFHTYTIVRVGNPPCIRFVVDQAQVQMHDTYIFPEPTRLYIANLDTVAGETITADWAKVRRYVEPEPQVSLAVE
jgi:hypothetical protein